MTERSSEGETGGGERICPKCDATFQGGEELCPLDGARLIFAYAEKEDANFVGRTLDGRFHIQTRIGAGAMGTVYRAWQSSVDRAVAVKIISRRMGASTMGVRRFLREARLASKLSQPNTVAILDFGQTDEAYLYLVMELLKGRTLLRVLRQEGALGVPRTVRIACQICDALEAAHGVSIIHRDLKPDNIFILDEPAGRDMVKVVDFGLAKSLTAEESEATMTGQIVGTPRYIAPEIWLGGRADERSDLYSLGVILCEMATGKPLFSGRDANRDVADRLRAERPQLPAALPDALRPIVERMLARDPGRRPASAAEARAGLVAAAGGDAFASAELSAIVPGAAVAAAGTEDLPPPSYAEVELRGGTVAERPAAIAAAEAAMPPRRRPRWLVAAGALVLSGALVAGGLLLTARMSGSGSGSESAAAPASAPEKPSPTPAIATPPPPASPTPAPATIEIELKATPTAKVTIDGHARGTTPVTLSLEPSSRPLDVVFERHGRKTVRREVIPDRSRTIEVTLPAGEGKRKKKGPEYPF